MFDFIPNILTTLIAIAFPTFAAYKALQSPTPALLTPWLTYFLILTLLHTVENLLWSSFLSWLPLYAWARLFAHIYLLLPGPYQGAGLVWAAHVQPFIRRHERRIEMLLQDVHDQTRALGLGRIIQLWEAVSAKLFGATGSEAANAARPAPPASNSYVSSLLGRFSAPVTGPGAQSGSGADVLSMLGSAAAAAASSYAGQGGKRGVAGVARGFEAPPPEDARERKAWVAAQKERLREMIGEVERLEKDGDGSTSGFETIDRSEAAAGGVERRKTSGGGWGSYIWGGKKEDDGKGTSADLAYGDK